MTVNSLERGQPERFNVNGDLRGKNCSEIDGDMWSWRTLRVFFLSKLQLIMELGLLVASKI